MSISKEIKVGFLTVVSAAIMYFGFQFLKGVDFFSPIRTYYMIYDNVNGLTISNPVMVNGFTVGRVKDLKLIQDGKDNRIKVWIDVDDAIEVGDGTTAILTSSDLLGGKMILLKLGVNKEIYESGKQLNARVEKSLTEELEEIAKPVIHNVDTTLTKVRNFIDAEDKASFKAILNNVEASSDQLLLMTKENRLATRQMAANLIDLSQSLKQTEKKFAPLLEKLDVFADSLNTLHLANTIADVENAISNLDSILVKINSDKGTIGTLLNDKQILEDIQGSMSRLDSLTQHFEEHPKHFIAPLGREPNKKSDHWDQWHGGYKKYKKTH